MPVTHRVSRGFTLIELLIVIGVIVVLIALLLPSVASVRARARTAQAQSNLTQLGLAIKAANRNRSTPVTATEKDANGKLIKDANGNPITAWPSQIQPFLEGENEALFVSPADPKANERGPDIPSFAANNQMHRMGSGDGNKIVMLDFEEEDQDGVFDAIPDPNNPANNNWAMDGAPVWQNALEAAGQRQGGNVNVLRDDGSVSSEPAQDLMDYHPQNSPEDWVPWRTPQADRWKCPTGDCEAPDELVDDLAPSVPEDTSEAGTPGEDTGANDNNEDTGEAPEDSTPLEDEGCYDNELGFPEVENFHMRSAEGTYGLIGPFRLDPNFWRFKLISMDDCNNYELWYECWDDEDWDCHLRFQRILSGPDAGKIRLSVKFVTTACAHYYLYQDANTPFPGNLTHFCNSDCYQRCGDNETKIGLVNVWLESDVLIDSDLGRPCACPPAVDAGADVSIAYPHLEYQLLGDASVDSSTGLPSEVFWTQLSGPPGVAFSDPTSLQPTATFPGEGVYVLKLTGMAGGGNSSDEIQVTVLPEGSTLYHYVRVKHTGTGPLCLSGIKIINNDGVNVAPRGLASGSTNSFKPEVPLAAGGCATYFNTQPYGDRWWMIEFEEATTIDSIEIENACNGIGRFLKGAQVEALDINQTKVWESDVIGGSNVKDGSKHTFNP